MSVLEYGSLESIVDSLSTATDKGPGLAPAELPDLPGLALTGYTLLANEEVIAWDKPEVYMVGVAFDATGTVFKLPVGVADIDPEKFRLQKQDVAKPYAYMGQGLPLVLPPTKGFLAVRLLIVDSDSGAREAAEVIKAAGEAVGATEVAALIAAAGVPQAAAVSLLLGKALEVTSSLMAKNRDDIIEAFEGYFSRVDMVAGQDLPVNQPHARASFRFVV